MFEYGRVVRDKDIKVIYCDGDVTVGNNFNDDRTMTLPMARRQKCDYDRSEHYWLWWFMTKVMSKHVDERTAMISCEESTNNWIKEGGRGGRNGQRKGLEWIIYLGSTEQIQRQRSIIRRLQKGDEASQVRQSFEFNNDVLQNQHEALHKRFLWYIFLAFAFMSSSLVFESIFVDRDS